MENQTKQCQFCKNDFVIETEDFAFYEKLNVPAPTWCPQCRFQRRLSFLNWMSLYKRICDRCGQGMITVHNQEKPFTVFCNNCWWKDDWDGTEYQMDYNPNKPFLQQMIELRNKSTFMGLESLYSSLQNTPYTNAAAYQKDCFMVFNADYGERCVYCVSYIHLTECLDNYNMDTCELCYESTGLTDCFKCIYSSELEKCSNVMFSKNLSGCTDCFGCMNLRNKNYHIFNQQYSREEYKEKLKSFNLDTREGIEKAQKEVKDFWLTQPERCVIGSPMNVNSTGNMLYECKNTKNGYIVSNVEDSKYVQLLTLPTVKDCYDYTIWGNGAEKLYECLTVGEGGYNNHFCFSCWPNAIDNEYCMYTIQSKDCFGCVNLKRKQYCILNKQYTKDEYEKLKTQIISDMKSNPYIDSSRRVWAYGQFLPFDLSPFAYNETIAQQFYPIDEISAKEQSLSWYDTKDNDYTVTLKKENLPKTILETSDSILNEIMKCDTCHKAYKINEQELYLLRKLEMPIPFDCWKCRHTRRFNAVNGPKLYDRNCDKCGIEMISSYAPDRPEIVYCEKCYQQEII